MTMDPAGDFDGLRQVIREIGPRPEGVLPSIPRYELLESIGEGGAAVVYRAVDRELGREVAVKVLREPLGADPTSRERFQREVRVAAGISHPNVVQVYDAGEADGRPYLVMERVDGRPFDAILGNGPRDLEGRVRILLGASEGVAAAHEQGVVHRDLKPGNILVTSAGLPKIADFGLAQVAGAPGVLTRSGSVMGTPMYMAPEQVRGRPGEIGPRTDVYALGAILYEILAGRPPHIGQSVSEIFSRITGEEPALPSRLDPRVPRDLETVAMRALDRDPARRYASAGELAADLRRYLQGEPVQARRPGGLYRLSKALRRRPALWTALAASLLLGVAWAVTLASSWSRLRSERDALRYLDEARPALEQAAHYLYDPGADHDGVARLAGRARPFLDRAAAAAPELPAVQLLLGRSWEIEGRDDLAEACWRRALAIDPGYSRARIHLGRLLARRASVAAFVGRMDRSPARRVEAEAAAREAVAQMEAAVGSGAGFDDDLQRAIAEAALAYVRGDADGVRRIAAAAAADHAGAEGTEELHWFRAAVSSGTELERELDRALTRRPGHPLALLARSALRREAGDLPGTVADCDAALRVNPRLTPALVNRAGASMALGRLEEAAADLDRAIDLDPREAAAYANRASLRLVQGRRDAALADADRALELDPRCSAARITRGNARMEEGRVPEAIVEYDLAIQADPANAGAWYNRGNARFALGNDAAAEEDYDAVLAIAPRDVEARLNRAAARVRRGRLDEALADCEEVATAAPLHPRAAVMRGEILAATGRNAEAAVQLERALELAPAGWKWRGAAAALLEEVRRRLKAGGGGSPK